MSSVDLCFGEFTNIILKEDDNCTTLKTNVKTPEDVEQWKMLYSKKYNVTLKGDLVRT